MLNYDLIVIGFGKALSLIHIQMCIRDRIAVGSYRALTEAEKVILRTYLGQSFLIIKV